MLKLKGYLYFQTSHISICFPLFLDFMCKSEIRLIVYQDNNCVHAHKRLSVKLSDCSLGRWRTGWYVSALKNLSSVHALKPLIPTFCFVVVFVYGQADKLRNFVAGIFIPQYHYPFPVALCFTQVSKCSIAFKSVIHSLTRRMCLRGVVHNMQNHLHTGLFLKSNWRSDITIFAYVELTFIGFPFT